MKEAQKSLWGWNRGHARTDSVTEACSPLLPLSHGLLTDGWIFRCPRDYGWVSNRSHPLTSLSLGDALWFPTHTCLLKFADAFVASETLICVGL